MTERLQSRLPKLLVLIGMLPENCDRTCDHYRLCFLFRRERVLIRAADGANPVFGNIGESCAGGNSIVGISHGGIINISAYLADILLHCFSFLLGVDCPLIKDINW